MFTILNVPIHERVLLHVNGVPTRFLMPGRHRVFHPLATVETFRFNVDKLVADMRPEQAALAPEGQLRVLTVRSFERALVYAQGKPAAWLKPGRHVLFTHDPLVVVEVLDTRGLEVTPLDTEVRKLVPTSDCAEVTVPAGCVALKHVDGVLHDVLPPGRHAAWTTTRQVNFAVLDLRQRIQHITGQEVMTKDRVSLRLNVSVVFQVEDPRLLATVAKDADEVLYLAAQMAVRDAVTSRTLDTLLGGRDQLAQELTAAIMARGASVGLKVHSLGLKDVILPGDMKDLLNKVMEAQKVAEANIIMRREEISATKALAQTAAVLQEHPVLMRLKELEAYKDLAGKVGTVHLMLGGSAVPQLQLKSE
jgi:regulator of protease activity HflC (stomatin/prohibitin superfamily)